MEAEAQSNGETRFPLPAVFVCLFVFLPPRPLSLQSWQLARRGFHTVPCGSAAPNRFDLVPPSGGSFFFKGAHPGPFGQKIQIS